MEVSARLRTQAGQTPQRVGEVVFVYGWVEARRDMGKIIFIDLRDATGLVQVVFALPEAGSVYDLAKELRSEYVIAVQGRVQKRTEKTINPKLATGTVEIAALDLRILNKSQTPPFELTNDTRSVNEETRLKYRYLDLRSERMQRNLILRDRVTTHLRDWLHDRGFLEIETPILTKGTPEGAREYLVPSRLHPGQFYVLPQSPQQFKQLLMVAGFDRYFQIARCFRDEDQRGDRQPEFTQLDLEMSFVDQEDILSLVEALFLDLVKTVAPEKHITQVPFPRLPYAEAMRKYNSDRPDIRKNKNDPQELGFCFVVDFPLFEWSEEEDKLVSTHHPFTAPRDEDVGLLEGAPEKALSKQHDFVLNGFEIAGGSIRIHRPDQQRQIFKILKLSEEEVERRFGHLLEAFSYGAPPHGGIAPGLDRLVMILAGEPNIREVMAFPKTGDARDPMMGAPSELPAKSLQEVHLKMTS